MEKEKLSTELRGMVGENGLSERTWNDYLDNSVLPFLPSEEEKHGEFLQKHANALKSINGQLNNEVATRVSDFKKNYKHEPPTPTQTTEPKPQEGKDEKLSDIEKRLQRFEKAEADKQAAETRNKTLSEVKKLMTKEGSTNETVINLILPQLEIREDAKAEDLAKSGKALYDKAYSDLYGDSYVPNQGGGSYGGGNKRSEQDAYLKHLKETGRIPNTN